MNVTKKMRTAEIVAALIERDGDICQMPGCPHPTVFTEKNYRTVDHWVPKSKGGADDMSNYALMHFRCNNNKGDRQFLPDGTLEPIREKEHKIKVPKRPPCETCYDGRTLLAGENCPVCGSDPQPKTFPKYLQRVPKECDHSTTHCWACVIGLYERNATSYLITGS